MAARTKLSCFDNKVVLRRILFLSSVQSAKCLPFLRPTSSSFLPLLPPLKCVGFTLPPISFFAEPQAFPHHLLPPFPWPSLSSSDSFVLKSFSHSLGPPPPLSSDLMSDPPPSYASLRCCCRSLITIPVLVCSLALVLPFPCLVTARTDSTCCVFLAFSRFLSRRSFLMPFF